MFRKANPIKRELVIPIADAIKQAGQALGIPELLLRFLAETTSMQLQLLYSRWNYQTKEKCPQCPHHNRCAEIAKIKEVGQAFVNNVFSLHFKLEASMSMLIGETLE